MCLTSLMLCLQEINVDDLLHYVPHSELIGLLIFGREELKEYNSSYQLYSIMSDMRSEDATKFSPKGEEVLGQEDVLKLHKGKDSGRRH
ncbi:hypothetical protein Tco_0217207 [Tanacetum coccineum]